MFGYDVFDIINVIRLITLIVAIVVGIKGTIKSIKMRSEGIIKEVTISDVKWDVARINMDNVYVNFRDEEGKQVEARTRVSKGAYKAGESVKIIYLPGESEDIHIYPGLGTSVLFNSFIAVAGAALLIWWILPQLM